MIRIVSTLLAACAVLACGDEFYPGFRVPSPDGTLVASFYGLGGGGAAGWAYQYVSIQPVDEPFAFEPSALQLSHGYEVCLHWSGPHKLTVTYRKDAEVHIRRDHVLLNQAVAVTYKVSPSSYGKLTRACEGKRGVVGGVSDRWR